MRRQYEAKRKIALEVCLVLSWQALRSFLLLFHIHGASCVNPFHVAYSSCRLAFSVEKISRTKRDEGELLTCLLMAR